MHSSRWTDHNLGPVQSACFSALYLHPAFVFPIAQLTHDFSRLPHRMFIMAANFHIPANFGRSPVLAPKNVAPRTLFEKTYQVFVQESCLLSSVSYNLLPQMLWNFPISQHLCPTEMHLSHSAHAPFHTTSIIRLHSLLCSLSK